MASDLLKVIYSKLDNLLNLLQSIACDVWVFISSTLENLDNLPNLIQGTGLALLAILIPLAIAILTDVYQKRNEESIDFIELDLHVILDNVFKIKPLILYISLIFIPMFFWEISLGVLRFIEIIFSLIGITLIAKIIYKFYFWIKGDVFKLRFSYLEKINIHSDLEVVWRSVWKTIKINEQNERKYFELYSSVIDNQLIKSKSKNNLTLSKLLNDFNNNINNRSIFSLVVYKEIFPKILEWHFKVWKEEQIQLKSNRISGEWGYYNEIFNNLGLIIEKIEIRVLKERQSSYFFRKIKRHLDNHKDDHVEINSIKRYYIEELLTIFCKSFFENIASSPVGFQIWEHYFPKEWKITKNNFENKDLSPIVNIFWNKFLSWAINRIYGKEEEFDKKLDNVSRNLFPEVEPFLWAQILTFFYSSYDESRIKSFVERSLNFGRIGRVSIYSFSGDNKDEMWEQLRLEGEDQRKKTYELACFLFNKTFSKENIEEYIKELKGLEAEYSKDSNEERKRLRLYNIFSEMLKVLKEQN